MKRRPPKVPARRGPIRVKVGVSIYQPDNTADITLAALHYLVDNDYAGLHTLLRQAIMDSLFKAYTIRFEASLPIMSKLYKAKLDLSPAKRRFYYEKLTEAEQQLSAKDRKTGKPLVEIGSPVYTKLRNDVVRYNKALTGTKLSETRDARRQAAVDRTVQLSDYEKSQERLANLSGSGSFKERAMQVLDRFTDPGAIRKQVRRTNLTVYFGNFQYMGDDGDPAMATNPRSTSKMNVMWRQLEFGTGKFAKRPGNSVQLPRLSEHKYLRVESQRRNPTTGDLEVTHYRKPLRDGSWVLGTQDNGGGLHILGSNPGNWLRKQSGLPYTEYAQAFDGLFAIRLSSALRKRR